MAHSQSLFVSKPRPVSFVALGGVLFAMVIEAYIGALAFASFRYDDPIPRTFGVLACVGAIVVDVVGMIIANTVIVHQKRRSTHHHRKLASIVIGLGLALIPSAAVLLWLSAVRGS